MPKNSNKSEKIPKSRNPLVPPLTLTLISNRVSQNMEFNAKKEEKKTQPQEYGN